MWSYRNAVYSLKENCGDTERIGGEGCLCQLNILLPCLSTVCCDHCVWKSTGNALEHPHLWDEKECGLPELQILWRIQTRKWENPRLLFYCTKKKVFYFIGVAAFYKMLYRIYSYRIYITSIHALAEGSTPKRQSTFTLQQLSVK